MVRSNLGERILTEYMKKLLENKDKNNFSIMAEKVIIRDIKEKACYIPNDNYENEIKKLENFWYELPDGNKIELREERIKCPEILFNPGIINIEEKNISLNCYEVIEKCDIDIKKIFIIVLFYLVEVQCFKDWKKDF